MSSLAVPIGAVIVTLAVIIVIGEMLLALADVAKAQESLDRWELWFALGLALLVILGIAFVASRPREALATLNKEVVIGSRPFFDPPPPPVDVRARTGPLGASSDIGEGYTLFAQNGALATVLGTLPGGTDYGKRFAGFLYAKGLHGASDELWIPIEAVIAVYPETQCAFLSIKGDETEHFGWDKPPETIRRGPNRIQEPI
ncbi:MAG: hypothetical protein H0W06_02915 [Chloroflexia bacterium]|nr:hypothetical protein [Chloroflexia bacterium]